MRRTKLLSSALAVLPLALSGNGSAGSHGADASWLARAQQQIAQREYEASRSERGMQAPNRAQSLRTYFTPAGIAVHERDAASAELLALNLAGVGRGSRLAPVEPGVVTSRGSRVEIARPELVEWYVNSPDGLEQGFTVARRPDGVGELVLELDVRGAQATLRGDSIALSAAATGRRLEYGQLAALDATGRALASRLELSPAGRVAIAVDDADATYPIVIDPILANAADTQLQPAQTHSQFGYSVAGAGDVNGDGYDDVIVGAPDYDAGQDNEGAAFVFLGGATGIANGGEASAASQLESDQDYAELGISVASAGDVNGDGYGDVIVGAPHYTDGEAGEGAAWVFLGSATGIASGGVASAAARFESDQANAQLGSSVASAGDVNRDGFGDVVVGAPSYGAGQLTCSGCGAAFVFRGGSTGVAGGNPATAATRLVWDQGNVRFGASVAGAGDVDGDGYGDVIIGAPGVDVSYAPEASAGQAYVFRGSATGIADGTQTTAATRLASDQDRAFFGYQVAGIGDANSDGYDDVIVGAPSYDAGETDEGAAFVFLGSAAGIPHGGPVTAASRLESNRESGQMGAAVARAGDVNNDGYDDVIVGAPFYDGPGPYSRGTAFVFAGSASGVVGHDPSTAAAFYSRGQDSLLGLAFSVAGAGDVNGDGYADLLVGEPWRETQSTFASATGAAFVLLGNSLIGPALLASDQPDSLFGYSVAGAGDANGDGHADVIIGAPWYDAGETNEGAAFVFVGSASGVADTDASAAATRLEADQAGAGFGGGVAGAGDVNGDGYDDVIVAASYYDADQTDEGAAFVFLGSATGIGDGGPTTAATRLETTPSQYSNWLQVAGAGDVNGDGFDDVLMGVGGYGSIGMAFVFHGSASGIANGNPTTAATRLDPSDAGWTSGISVASAGDVNGDGYADVIVGDFGAYVFHGSATGIADATGATAATRIEPFDYSADLGVSVAGAGDVNGDGYSDVIVGAPYTNEYTPTPKSAAYVFLGGPNGVPSGNETTASSKLVSDLTHASMGRSVAGAGDVNADGYDDVIVGAPNYAGTGEAFVFHGSASGIANGNPATAARRLGARIPSAACGTSVAGAGDVNGDGVADVIVGAPVYNSNDPQAGRAWVVLPEPGSIPSFACGGLLLAALARRRRLATRAHVGNAPCR